MRTSIEILERSQPGLEGRTKFRIWYGSVIVCTMTRLSRSAESKRLWYVLYPGGRDTVRRGQKDAFALARAALAEIAAKAFANAT